MMELMSISLSFGGDGEVWKIDFNDLDGKKNEGFVEAPFSLTFHDGSGGDGRLRLSRKDFNELLEDIRHGTVKNEFRKWILED